MKKTITLLLCVAVLFGVLAPVCYGAESTNGKKLALKNAVTFECEYDAETQQVTVNGTVNHDVMMNYHEYDIHLVSLLPGETEGSVTDYSEEDILARTPMTVKFDFCIDVGSAVEKYSKYAIVFESPEGERFASGTPKIPAVTKDFSYDVSGKSNFKGIVTDSSLDIGTSGAGTVIIDFDIAEGLGDVWDGYLYHVGEAYVYVKKSYVDEIDQKMISASLNGSKVYIRLLLNSGAGILESVSAQGYGTPNVYSEYVLDRVFAITQFLTERYNGESGQLFGFIVGTQIDKESSVLDGSVTVEEFSDLYALYLMAVGNCARAVNGNIDVVIPISDSTTPADEQALSYKLVENVIKRLDGNASDAFACSVMIESEHLPSEINGEEKESYLTVNELDGFMEYFNRLGSEYGSAPLHVIYKWKPSSTLSGSELCCAYIYSYMKLLNYEKLAAFVLDLSENEVEYSTVKKLFERIDTGADEGYINAYAEYLGASSWEELLGDETELPVLRGLIKEDFTVNSPEGTVGEFLYMDFSASSLTSLMTQGENCSLLTSLYDKEGNRLLRVSSKEMDMGEWFELIGRFDYPESYYYTPVMSIELEIEDTGASEYALYELCFTLGNKETRIDVNGTVKPGERTVLYFDASEFSQVHNAEYFKISARCLTEETKGISILLHSVRGYSSQYDSEELAVLVDEYRAGVREPVEEEEEGVNKTAIIAVAVSIIAVGAGLFMVFRREDDKGKND